MDNVGITLKRRRNDGKPMGLESGIRAYQARIRAFLTNAYPCKHMLLLNVNKFLCSERRRVGQVNLVSLGPYLSEIGPLTSLNITEIQKSLLSCEEIFMRLLLFGVPVAARASALAILVIASTPCH